jgi:transposase InsO family protein
MGYKRDWSKIGEIVQKIDEHHLSYREGAKQFGIKVKDIYEYNYRIKGKPCNKNKGAAGADKANVTSKPGEGQKEQEGSLDTVSTSCVPQEVQKIILSYRTDNPDHGYKRIEEHLKSHHFIVISRKKIREVLKAHGLEKTLDSSFDRKDEDTSRKGTRRFEADYPRDLYQMDVTYVYITGIPVLYLTVIIDDYSRFCICADLRHDQRASTMIDVLHRAIQHYGKPRRLLTDQGTSFYTWSHEGTIFQKYLDDMEIEHIVTDPHSPQTIGKVERLNQTIQREVLRKVRFNGFREAQRGIEDYIHSYNYERPHQGIKGACPAERFHGIIGETDRIESMLVAESVDFSKGYLIFKNQDHTISVVASTKGLEVFLDGNLLKGGASL